MSPDVARSRRRDDSPLAVLLWAYAGAAVLVAAVLVAAHELGRSARDFTGDTTVTLEGPPYIGLLSNVGAILWSTSMAACAISACVLRQPVRGPFVWGGVLSFLLLMDDLFLVHEGYLPRIGVPEGMTAVVYGISTLVFLVVYRDFVRGNGWALLPAALVLLALSAGIDFEDDTRGALGISVVLEDGVKFFGIVTWCVFFVRAAVHELRVATSVTAGSTLGS